MYADPESGQLVRECAMELKTFIKETLQQILEGVQEAQSSDLGMNVNASTDGGSAVKELGGNLINRGRHGVFTRVDFDVSVSAETSGKGGAKLTVFGIGGEAGAEHRAASANRISFSVPVRLPDGDKARSEQAAVEQKEKDKRSLEGLRNVTRGIV
jgi:hypothetical protein